MTRDDIIRMARECGLTINDQPMLGVEHFATLVAAAEREACAKICDEVVDSYAKDKKEELIWNPPLVLVLVAGAIRKRGKQE